MAILGVNEIFQKIIGSRAPGEGYSYGYIMAGIYVSVSMLLIFLSLTTNFVLHINDDFNKAWPSLPLIFGYFSAILVYWHFLFNGGRFHSLLWDLREIVSDRICLEAKKMLYVETQRRIDILIKRCMIIWIPVPMMYITPFMIVAYHWCVGKYTIDSWVFNSQLWTPFAVNTAFRCAALEIFEMFCDMCGCAVFCLVICIFIEFTFYTKTFVMDIKTVFTMVDRLAWKTSDMSTMFGHCKEAIQLHERILRCMDELAGVSNWIIFIFVPPYIISACSSILAIERHERGAGGSLLDLQMPIIMVFFSLGQQFIFFFFGQKLNSNLLELSDVIYQTKWHRYPSGVRRFILLMMMRAQRPFHLSAYGLIELNLKNFVVVLKSIYSAFMVLRSVN